jgi:uncharacterized protein
MDTHSMLVSEARVATAMSRRYLAQLCKHFQHKLPASLTETYGRIEFPAGVCTLNADTDGLLLRVTASDEAALARLEEVITRHLGRFAFREMLEIHWRRVLHEEARAS